MFNMVVLEMVHQMCSITLTEENKSNIMLVVIWIDLTRICNKKHPFKYLDLFIGSHSTEYDFCEILGGKHSKTNPTDRFVVLD